MLVVESIWPNAAFEEGVGINALISAEAAPPNGGAVFHDTAVWLRKEPVAKKARGRGSGTRAGMIDLYSDTHTTPTPGMRRAMAEAEVGDEQMFLDPTVNRLCERVAALLGKEGRGLSAVRDDVQPDRGAGALPPGRRGDPRGERASVPCRIGRTGGARRSHDAPDPGRARGMFTAEQVRAAIRPAFPPCSALAPSGGREHEQLGGGAVAARAIRR